MSQEGVELVRQLQPLPGVDLADVFMRGDEAGAAGLIEEISLQFTDDFVCVFHALSREERCWSSAATSDAAPAWTTRWS